MPARVWGYVASTFELGGVANLGLGGQHMTFSSFSLSLHLAFHGELWDGDVIAEDHHAFLKAFFYSTYVSMSNAPQFDVHLRSRLTVRPVMLPVKSTSLQCSYESGQCIGWYRGWVERFHQARRHQHGIAEVSYTLLSTYELLRLMPCNIRSLRLVHELVSVLRLPFAVYILPNIETVALFMMTVFWLWNGQTVPSCSTSPTYLIKELVCGTAGAWTLIWPMVIPFLLVGLVNFLIVLTFFVQPAANEVACGKSRTWFVESGMGGFPRSKRCFLKCSLAGLIIFDLLFLLPLSTVYGFWPGILACWSVCRRGNRFEAKKSAKPSVLLID